ncbi:hypothetical protein GCK72_001303 [Caenorhabditis remanei]|uniref:Uncharacterized protein n=1 Tax=Caenorhabditis remanei TaxID=31234 RepID=A0A6A5HRY4_CAERE|nr:hypothetical protein GCK72_001303 [Caenorhabditis remanei]KAF1769486.1 hypothetical protein GCK72_001303 [Caenorhabditis remanei]
MSIKDTLTNLKAEWPKMQEDYEPELWENIYQEKHAKSFFESVDLLRKIENLSEQEAERKLLDILIKVTFIETSLTIHGKQDAETLFDNLKKAQNDKPNIPFSSAEDVKSFCDSMKIIFRKDMAHRYRNTGVQSRRFVQEMRKRLELGDVIKEANFDDIVQDFRSTIVNKYCQKFAEKEAGLDFSTLYHFSKAVNGFKFDMEQDRLFLDEEASDCISLLLPIFTDTINSQHAFKLDASRHVSGFFTLQETCYPERSQYFMLSDELFQIEAALYRKNLSNKENNQAFGTVISGSGRILPNHPSQQIEIFELELYPFSFLNNLVTENAGKTLVKGIKYPSNANTVNGFLTSLESTFSSRLLKRLSA